VSVPASIQALLEQTADSLENLQRLLTRSEEGRIAANTTLAGLSDRLGAIGEYLNAGQGLMARLTDSQTELQPALARLAATAENSLGQDDVLRTHLRNIEGYMPRLIEDATEGRAQSAHEPATEIRLLARPNASL